MALVLVGLAWVLPFLSPNFLEPIASFYGEVAAMVLTPICPHTLSFRPVVLPASSSILVCPHHLNAGSRVNFDGQVNVPIGEDECLLIRRATTRFMLVENPQISHWQMLAQKMHWAESPRL